jgi:pyruvate dehydrogenase complex dehydrogenase (E1) component
MIWAFADARGKGFLYELAAILEDGIQRMYQEREEHFYYYITLYNEECRKCRRVAARAFSKGSTSTKRPQTGKPRSSYSAAVQF